MNDFQKILDDKLKLIHINSEDSVEIYNDYDIFQELKDLLITTRKRRGLTQKRMAELSGLTQANISNFENGTTRPSIDSLKKIADALNMRLVIDFIEGDREL